MKFLIEPTVQEKILWKHGIKREEFDNSLDEGNPRFFKIRDNIYMAVTHHNRYMTVIYQYKEPNNAIVKTAYPSGESQIRRYKKK